jgi:crotonobetainyl-CoA:carnitine CoA-transferase CaiB-like acyl-CoA transferase
MAGPLDGYRIIDLTQVVSGPLATMLLADQGADVVKVEPAAGGDLTRIAGLSRGGITPFFMNNNRGKRSFAVDLQTADGVDLVLRLCDTADVFVQNFRPGVVERLGLGHEVVMARNPNLIYVSVSGYGATGPYAQRRVYDPIIQGITGHVAVQCNPQIPFTDVHRSIVADKSTSYTVAQAITAALLARERGRVRGQLVEVAMVDAALAFFWPDGMMSDSLLDDDPAVRARRVTLAKAMSVTRCGTGELIYFVASDSERHGLFRALGRADLIDDPRFGTLAGIQEAGNYQALGEILLAEFEKWDAADLLERMVAEDVPCGPVNDLESLVTDPQIVHNGAVWEWVHPTAGRIRHARPAPRMSATPIEPQPVASLLGEHTDEVLGELGVDAATIAGLRARGVVA